MLTYGQLQAAVQSVSLVTSQPTLIQQAIGIALDRVYQHFDFPYYMDSKNGIITTYAGYNTGTCTATQGSNIIVGQGTTWTASMTGYKIRVGNGKPFYRIVSVNSTTNITLNTIYQDTSVVLSTYSIYKDEYKLQPDVDKQKMARQLENGVPMMDLSPKTLDFMVPTPQNYADPLYMSIIGTDEDTYNTGTVTATGNTITGVGTGWTTVEGLGRMSRILVGSPTSGNVYTVQSVNSDTSLTVFDNITTVTAPTSYQIYLNNIVVQVYFIPNLAEILLYRYFRLPSPLINNNDLPDMPYEFHWLLIYGALSLIYMQKGDMQKSQQECEVRFLQGLDQMKMKLGSFAPDRINRRKSVDGLRQRRFDGVENSNYDWRFAAY